MRSVFNDLLELTTEQVNPETIDIDQLDSQSILKKMNVEDNRCATAVAQAIPQIAKAVDLIEQAMRNGGRLFYIGAGTSGRLGVLDASECPPTFGLDPSIVQGIIAGGPDALIKSKEGVEDQVEQGWVDLKERNVTSADIVCGIMASGRTPYVVAALEEAKKNQIKTISIVCNTDTKLKVEADVNIRLNAGPEVIMGSTRLKAGTMQKMVLNMLTTATMIRLGKVYQNIMVDLQQNSNKLRERSKRIIIDLCGVTYDEAERLLEASGHNVKLAIGMSLTGQSKDSIQMSLKRNHGRLASVINELRVNSLE
ncbi:MAG: N-acetylmuramic acid 6-phosphate etherase [Calditrichaeota bacterium]|nr:N-acetylmuramic acid 6-phosphate etherase [Calditrichota bacterium]